MSRRRERVAADVEPGERADKALARALTAAGTRCSRKQARTLVERGRVAWNDRLVRRSSDALASGPGAFTVEADAADYPAEPQRVVVALLDVRDDIVVIDKPAGIPSDTTRDAARETALTATARALRAAGHDAEGLRAVHRLDVGTSGVLLLARGADAAATWGEAFRARDAHKVYRALATTSARGPRWAPEAAAAWPVGETRRVDVPLGRVGGRGHGPRDDGKPATTDITLLARCGARAWFEARPITGRTHQIRVHLRTQGWVIVGDTAYGATEPAARVMLHAASLEIGDERWSAPTPNDLRALLRASGIEAA